MEFVRQQEETLAEFEERIQLERARRHLEPAHIPWRPGDATHVGQMSVKVGKGETVAEAAERVRVGLMNEGRKDDIGKLRYDLIPPGPLSEIAKVFTIGAKKYDDRNWEKGIKWGRVFGALMRHAWKWWAGEENDSEDGQHHLASVAWCCLVLMEYERTHPEMDDRGKS